MSDKLNEKKMPAVVLFGAYDRYNFGDNLMPIFFEVFFKKFYPHIMESHSLVFAALFDSDLSLYKCKKTEPISKYFGNLEKGSVVIVVGGEVIGSKALSLYSNTTSNATALRLLKLVARGGDKFSALIGSTLCRTGFEYPFVPTSTHFQNKAKVCFNSAGGTIPKSGPRRALLIERLKNATFVSVRDRRTLKKDSSLDNNMYLAPDVVAAVEELFPSPDIETHISQRIRNVSSKRYILFQASPHKLLKSAEDVSDALLLANESARSIGMEIILLPIGYASGHDDFGFLEKISRLTGLQVISNLNVWEILWMIKSSRAFFGTSLHGIIVSMAYAVPYFGVGNVSKIESYLKEWSEYPFLLSKEISNIPDLIQDLPNLDHEPLARVARHTRDEALRNLHNLVYSSGLSE